ncbi:MAG: MFS transporter [Actinobacteria bacterium]|nr:MAG: MFS transporter [Actinomycetota bacterium]
MTDNAMKSSIPAILLLGVIGGIETAAPNISSSALVSVSRDLHMSTAELALAASAQTILIAATVITTGMLADRLGRRLVLSIGLLVGAAGSAVCAFAPSPAVYVAGQAIVGIGLGAAYGSAFAYLRAVAPPGRLALSLGLCSATIAFTTVGLTFLGSILIASSWRLGLASTAAASIAAVLTVRWLLPRQPRVPGVGLDLPGQALLGCGVAGFLVGVSQLGRSLTAPSSLVPLLAGALLLTAFGIREARSATPFFPIRLFASPSLVAATLAFFVYYFATAVVFLQTTNLWQYVTRIPMHELALWQLPLIATGVVSPILVGRLLDRGVSSATALLAGMLVTAAGLALLARASQATSFTAFLPGTVLVGAGVFGAMTPACRIVLREAPKAQYGPVTSSPTTIGQFWYSIGLALSTILLDRMTVGGVTDKLLAAGVQPDLVGTAVTAINQYVSAGTPPSTALARQALADASATYASAFSTVMLITAGLVLAAGGIGVVLLRRAGAGVNAGTS